MKAILCILVVAHCFLSTTPAFGASMLPLTFHDLVSLSDRVIVGEIVEKHSAWADDSTAIYTYYTISIDSIGDSASDSAIELRATGGWVGETGMDLAGIPAFDLHDQVLLFLSRDSSRDFPVVGWEAGVFRLVGERGSLDRAVFTHDWWPVRGLDSTGIQIESPARSARQGVPSLSAATAHERKKASALMASECIRLKRMLEGIKTVRRSFHKKD